jgi:hypothetical protein
MIAKRILMTYGIVYSCISLCFNFMLICLQTDKRSSLFLKCVAEADESVACRGEN